MTILNGFVRLCCILLAFSLFSVCGVVFAQDANNQEILESWARWVEGCTDSLEAVSISEKVEGQEQDTVYLIELGDKQLFHWCHRYLTSKGKVENVVAGNESYSFILRKNSDVFQIADLKTAKETDFKESHTKAFNRNPLINMLLGGGPDSIVSLVSSGKVESFQLLDERNAKFVVVVADQSDTYDTSRVTLSLTKRSTWLPTKVSWETVAVPSGERSMSTYQYLDWTMVGDTEMPTVVEAISRRNGMDTTYTNQLNFALSEQDSADIDRFYLSDFGFPEPDIPSSVAIWMWFVLGGTLLVLVGVWLKWRAQSSSQGGKNAA